MTYRVIDSNRIGAQAIGTVSTTRQMILGDVVNAKDENLSQGDFVYVQASNSVTQYDAVAIKAGYKIAPLTITNAITAVEIGFAQVAFADKDSYGYVQKGGRPIVRFANGTQANADLYASATGGVLSSVSSSAQVQGLAIITTVTNSAGPATCVARYPHVVKDAPG